MDFFILDRANFPPPLAYPDTPGSSSPSNSPPPIVQDFATPPNTVAFDTFSSQTLPSRPPQATGQQQSTLPPVNLLSNLGKDADVLPVRKLVCSLLKSVEWLLTETELVFTSIEQIYASDPSPIVTTERLENLIKAYAKLESDLLASGLGGLPIDTSTPYDIYSLIRTKIKQVEQLYNERQNRRAGSAIVVGVLQAFPTPSNVPTPAATGTPQGIGPIIVSGETGPI